MTVTLPLPSVTSAIWFSGRPNVGAYKYGGNVRYTLQRVTGGIAFVFILYHLWHMHWLGDSFGGGFFDFDNDGWDDLYTPNGFVSGKSMKDT